MFGSGGGGSGVTAGGRAGPCSGASVGRRFLRAAEPKPHELASGGGVRTLPGSIAGLPARSFAQAAAAFFAAALAPASAPLMAIRVPPSVTATALAPASAPAPLLPVAPPPPAANPLAPASGVAAGTGAGSKGETAGAPKIDEFALLVKGETRTGRAGVPPATFAGGGAPDAPVPAAD